MRFDATPAPKAVGQVVGLAGDTGWFYRPAMSRRIDPSWLVFKSIENDAHDRCVDLFSRPDGTFGFEEFRRDVEDRGVWTPVSYFSDKKFSSRAEAWSAALAAVVWLPAT
ncbi:hypothetical protein BH10PSE9_BH10PSE9_02380 [soil metagenome]